jgi:hypothetical protein
MSLEKRHSFTTPSWPLANVKWVELMKGECQKIPYPLSSAPNVVSSALETAE